MIITIVAVGQYYNCHCQHCTECPSTMAGTGVRSGYCHISCIVLLYCGSVVSSKNCHSALYHSTVWQCQPGSGSSGVVGGVDICGRYGTARHSQGYLWQWNTTCHCAGHSHTASTGNNCQGQLICRACNNLWMYQNFQDIAKDNFVKQYVWALGPVFCM